MLEVDEPPKLGPWDPMSFDELYSGPIVAGPKPEPRTATSDHPSAVDKVVRHDQLKKETFQPCLLPLCLHYRIVCHLDRGMIADSS